jgi:NADH-quinone oxidoreductase subunit G
VSDQVKVSIDGHEVSVPRGTLVVEAARKIGIEIPVYCYHPKMAPVGACRICLVEVDIPGQRLRNPIMAACTTEVAEGMQVQTRSPQAHAARAGILEFLLANHPLDCPVCDRGGECDLQDFALRYGRGVSRFVEVKRHFPKSVRLGANVVLDRERCIMCQRCVRFCSEVALEEGLVILERGARSEIGTFQGRPYDSNFSGNTVEICPVGALTAASYRFRARPWELQSYEGVCPHCSLGCNLTVDVRFDEVRRFRSRTNDAIDDGWLCDRGRYGHGFLHPPDRLRQPLVRRDGQLVPASWEEALGAAAEGFRRAAESHGPGALGVVGGLRLGNEAAWLLVRLARGVLGTGNLDHRRGLAWLGEPPRPLPLSARVAGLDEAQAVVVAGCDPTETTPVLDLRIKKALRRGARLLILGNRATGLDRFAHVRLPGSLDQVLADLIQRLEAHPEPAQEPPGLAHPRPQPWEPGGRTSTDPVRAAAFLAGAERVVLIFDEEASAREAQALVDLACRLGVVERKPWGLLQLLAGCNSRGLREMGLLPTFGPGFGALEGHPALAAWGAPPPAAGLDYAAMTAEDSPLRALLVVADDPLAGRQLRHLEHLVVADTVLTETARLAQVVLPLTTFAEEVQTFTATDGTVQISREALPCAPGTLPAWLVVRRLAAALGQEWSYGSAAEVFAEIGRLNPLYSGLTYRSFQAPGVLHWSYPIQGRIGTPRPDLSAIPSRDPDAPPWVLSVDTGTAVEKVARVFRGETPPPVPNQEDPRLVAAALSLEAARRARPEPEASLPAPAAERIVPLGQAQPPGPNPAWRYHHLGVRPRVLVAEPPLGPKPQPEPAPEEAP